MVIVSEGQEGSADQEMQSKGPNRGTVYVEPSQVTVPNPEILRELAQVINSSLSRNPDISMEDLVNELEKKTGFLSKSNLTEQDRSALIINAVKDSLKTSESTPSSQDASFNLEMPDGRQPIEVTDQTDRGSVSDANETQEKPCSEDKDNKDVWTYLKKALRWLGGASKNKDSSSESRQNEQVITDEVSSTPQENGGKEPATRGISFKGAPPLSVASVLADLAGYVDPTPISDIVGAVISLAMGDWFGAGASLISTIPGLDFAKMTKIIRNLDKIAPGIGRLLDASNPTKCLTTLKGICQSLRQLCPGGLSDLKNQPGKVKEALNFFISMAEDAAKRYNPKWLEKAKKEGLPTEGPITFVPPKKSNPDNPPKERVGNKVGFKDDYGNVWVPGPSRTSGHDFEWDIIPASPNSVLARFSRDGSHVNVSLDGVVTHR